MACTVVIVDDHAEFRAQAARLLEDAGYEVLALCPDGRSAVTTIRELCPDVVLLDVQLPDIDGFEVMAELDAGATGPAVVLVSSRDAIDYGARVDGSGAVGFIAKAELSARSLAEVMARR